jgi:hypothetical protein
MPSEATFRFYGNLNDFLLRSRRGVWIPYRFNDFPSVKDAIEAIGIPHVEVDVIRINQKPVSFSHQVFPDDRVEVYPLISGQHTVASLTPAVSHFRFVLDVHLGKLARELRLLGFDTFYENDLSDKTIVEISVKDERIILTRDIALLKHKVVQLGYWLRSQDPEVQLKEVFDRYNLYHQVKPFVRCLACNGMIFPAAKDAVSNLVPSGTLHYFKDFYQCNLCQKVYWKGSHYEKLERLVSRFTK